MNKGLINSLTKKEIELLQVNQFSFEEIKETIENNAVIDFYFGNSRLIDFATIKKLETLTKTDLEAKVKEAKKKSVLELALNTIPSCNAACNICYTNSNNIKSKKEETISTEQSKEIIDKAVYLGVKSLFIAGTGEPTLDVRLFEILHHAKNKNINSYVFVNGITLSNDDEAKTHWGVNSLELSKMFKETNCYIGPKLWTLNPKKLERMTKTKEKYIFTELDGVTVPKVFDNLDKAGYPRNKIIANMAVTTQNFDEVDDIVEFCLKRGYKLFIEEFVQTGRAKNKSHLCLSKEQRDYFSPLASQDCIKPKIQIVVSHDGYLLECKAIDTQKKEENSVIYSNGKIKNIFEIRHSLYYLVNLKYNCKGRCYCEFRQNQSINLCG